jgi:hypothetical protein
MQSPKYNYNGNYKCPNEKNVWEWISRCSTDLDFLEKNLENLNKIDWHILRNNLNIEPLLFNIDYEKMRQVFQPISKEIIEYVFYPTRLARFADKVGIDVVDYLEYF